MWFAVYYQIMREEAEYGKPENSTGVWMWFHLMVPSLLYPSEMDAPSPSHSPQASVDDPLPPPPLITNNRCLFL
jgi:hypothetical protein